ncbi:MAG: hypothetical protein ABJO01_03215 [Parasphingorhabdus sp.]|uniref:hypothetical protein n=1 Tax=Parasphingorhabdus sp. TaxID=2709688 RepID=UPI00329A2DD0
MFPGKIFLATFLSAILMLLQPVSAMAKEPIFPNDGVVGLVPPGAMIPADSFSGFLDSAAGASIIVASFPVAAYAEIAPNFTAERLASRMTVTSPVQPVTLDANVEALLVKGEQIQQGTTYRKWVLIARNSDSTAMVTIQIPQNSKGYSDEAVMASLQSVRFQMRGTLEEEIDQLPFVIADRAQFRAVRTLAGSGLILTDGPQDIVPDASQPLVIVASSLGSNPSVGRLTKDQRETLALGAMKSLPFTDFQADNTTMEEDGDIVISGQGTDDGGRVMLLRQIMRFGPYDHVRTVCIFTKEQNIIARCDQLGQAVRLKSVERRASPAP